MWTNSPRDTVESKIDDMTITIHCYFREKADATLGIDCTYDDPCEVVA